MWLNLPKYSEGYINGVNAFLKNAFDYNYFVGDELRCPCKQCKNDQWHYRNVVFDHLICNGASPDHAPLIYDVSCIDSYNNLNDMDCDNNMPLGDDIDAMLRATYPDVANLEETNEGLRKGMNADARKFYRLMDEGKQPLYPGCKDFSCLSFIVQLYLLKCIHGVSEAFFTALLVVLRAAFPFATISKSFLDAKNSIKDLGLDYQKIHACPNDCMLYWRVNENKEVCESCGLSRWKEMETDNVGVNKACEQNSPKIPAKVMRYFPLRPRLQRLFMSKESSQLMRWHAVERKNDGKLRHPADGEAWKRMDTNYPHFPSEIRNVRLGLASDWFNPFRTMSISHSTWPIILANYNLPSWLSMKSENLILSTLIPGPTSPGNNIDVYFSWRWR